MEAAKVYINLIGNIEDSQLNYAMSKTPYSVTISLKSSFLKQFPADIYKSDVKLEKKEDAVEEERLNHWYNCMFERVEHLNQLNH